MMLAPEPQDLPFLVVEDYCLRVQYSSFVEPIFVIFVVISNATVFQIDGLFADWPNTLVPMLNVQSPMVHV